MKTMEEACRRFSAQGALTSYDGVMKDLAASQEAYAMLLQVACMEGASMPMKLQMAMGLGVAIGIEMEKA
jgi:hypothetical protein